MLSFGKTAPACCFIAAPALKKYELVPRLLSLFQAVLVSLQNAICLKDEDIESLDQRCRGFAEGLGDDATVQLVTAIKGQSVSLLQCFLLFLLLFWNPYPLNCCVRVSFVSSSIALLLMHDLPSGGWAYITMLCSSILDFVDRACTLQLGTPLLLRVECRKLRLFFIHQGTCIARGLVIFCCKCCMQHSTCQGPCAFVHMRWCHIDSTHLLLTHFAHPYYCFYLAICTVYQRPSC